MAKICIFSRTSTTQQDVEQQTKALIDEALRLGYTEKNQIIVEYQESGTKLDIETRQGIKKLKECITKDSSIDTVICWELTRIARRADVIYNIRDFLLEHHIRWIILKPSYMELIDRSGKLTPAMSLILGIFVSFAESEMAIKAARFQRAKDELTRQGKKSAGAVIFGYIKDNDKKCIPHPVHANIIRDMFYHYAETDDSFSGTYEYLFRNYSSYLKPLNRHEATCKVKHWMEKEIYWKGNWCYPPLVPEDIAQKTIEKKKKARCVTRYRSKLEFLGRGRFRCAVCGNRLVGIGGRENAYVCCTDKSHSVQIKCDVADWILWDEARVIANLAAMTDRNSQVVEVNQRIEQSKQQIEQINKQIDELNVRQERLLSVYVKGTIQMEHFDKLNSELNDEIKRLENERNKISVQIEQFRHILDGSQRYTEAKPVNFDSVSDFVTKQEIIRKYIDYVNVEKIGKGELRMTIETTMPLIRPVSVYHYVGHGHKKLIRINEDGTEDRIF